MCVLVSATLHQPSMGCRAYSGRRASIGFTDEDRRAGMGERQQLSPMYGGRVSA